MSGRKSRTKGATNERALAAVFKAWWGHGEWARTPSSGGWATAAHREAFRTCGDIITTARDFPFCVEAKKHEKWCLDNLIHNDKPDILGWWKQAKDETPPDMIPLLVFARNNVPQAVMFDDVQVFQALHITLTAPWYGRKHFLFNLDGRDLVIMSLEAFFTITPDFFGRTLPMETGRPKPEDRPKVPEPVIPTCTGCKKPMTACTCTDNNLKK